MKAKKGLIHFLTRYRTTKAPNLTLSKWEKFLEDVFKVSEKPPILVILRGTLYDMKKPKQKAKAQKVWRQMLEDARRKQ